MKIGTREIEPCIGRLHSCSVLVLVFEFLNYLSKLLLWDYCATSDRSKTIIPDPTGPLSSCSYTTTGIWQVIIEVLSVEKQYASTKMRIWGCTVD